MLSCCCFHCDLRSREFWPSRHFAWYCLWIVTKIPQVVWYVCTYAGLNHVIPTLAVACLQRWPIMLSACNYKILSRSTKKHANADGLSRLPLNFPPRAEASRDAACYNLSQIQALPITAAKVGSYSRHDSQVSRVMHFTRYGWPASVPSELKLFYSRCEELTVEGDCLQWGVRVVVPAKLRHRVLHDLY